jgi:hypothetical protein
VDRRSALNTRGVGGRDVVGNVDTGAAVFHHAFRKVDGIRRIVSLLELTVRQTISATGSPTVGSIKAVLANIPAFDATRRVTGARARGGDHPRTWPSR